MKFELRKLLSWIYIIEELIQNLVCGFIEKEIQAISKTISVHF